MRHFCCVILDLNRFPSLPPFTLVEMYPVKTHVSKSVLSLTPSDLKFHESSVLSTKVCCRGKDKVRFRESQSNLWTLFCYVCSSPTASSIYTHKHADDQTKRTQGRDKRQRSSKTQRNPDPHRLCY